MGSIISFHLLFIKTVFIDSAVLGLHGFASFSPALGSGGYSPVAE